VAAGCVAEKFLNKKFETEIVSWVNSIGNSKIPKDVSEKLISNPPNRNELDLISKFDIYERINDKVNEQKFSHISYSFLENLMFCNAYNKKIYHFSKEIDKFDDIDKYSDQNDIKITSENKKILVIGNNKYEFKESIITRCPHIETSLAMIKTIIEVKLKEDSIGGVVTCVVKNCPASIGEPCFDKLEADLAKAMLSIPATKGFEIGSGFEGTKLK
jgi:chorismate synthase